MLSAKKGRCTGQTLVVPPPSTWRFMSDTAVTKSPTAALSLDLVVTTLGVAVPLDRQ